MDLRLIGIVGLLCLVAGWIPQTVKIIREKQTIDKKFGVLYTVGSLLLMTHAIILKDLVFIILNALAALMSGLSLFFTIKNKK